MERKSNKKKTVASSKSIKTPKERETSAKMVRPLRPVKSMHGPEVKPSRPSKRVVKEKVGRKKEVSPPVSLPTGFFKIYDALRHPSAHPGIFIDSPTFPNWGNPTRLRYRAVRATTQPGFLVFGQYEKGFPVQDWIAVFSVVVDNNTFDDAYVGTLDVVQDSTRVIAKMILTRKDFPEAGKPVRFALPFRPTSPDSKLEFRLYYMGYTYMAIKFICIVDPALTPLSSPRLGEGWILPEGSFLSDEELAKLLPSPVSPFMGDYVYNLRARGYDLYNEIDPPQKLVITGYSTYMWTDMSFYPWDGPYKGKTPAEFADIIRGYNACLTRVFCIDTWTSSLFPWSRVGQTGKFDLNRFDPIYMENLKNLVRSFGERGIIVVLDLFDNVALWDTPSGMTWRRHPFNAANGGPITNPKDGRPEFYNPNPTVRALQENYVRYMVDSLREYKNIIFEVCNEYNMGGGATWHNWVADVIKSVNPEVLVSASLEVDKPGYFDVWSYKNTDIIYDHTGGWVSRDFKTIWKNYVTIKLKEPGKPVLLSTDGCEENYPAQHRDMVNAAKFAIDQNCGVEFKDLYEPVAQEVKAFAVPLAPAGTV